MKLYLALLLLSSAGVLASEDSVALPKSLLEIVIAKSLRNHFDELSKHDPFHVDHVNQSYLDYNIDLYNVNAEGFSNVQVHYVFTWGRLRSKYISLELYAPRFSTSVENFIIAGPNSAVTGHSSLELVGLKTQINARVNLLSHDIEEYKASFHLEHGNVSIVAIRDDVDYGQNATLAINHYLNEVFNHDYKLHEKISNGLKKLLEDHW